MVRVRFPAWSVPDVSGFVGDIVDVILVPVFALFLALVRVLVTIPVALGRAAVSKTRWVEAQCRWPVAITIRRRTSSARGAEVADEVARRLAAGYKGGTFIDGAELESMTEPPALSDLDA